MIGMPGAPSLIIFSLIYKVHRLSLGSCVVPSLFFSMCLNTEETYFIHVGGIMRLQVTFLSLCFLILTIVFRLGPKSNFCTIVFFWNRCRICAWNCCFVKLHYWNSRDLAITNLWYWWTIVFFDKWKYIIKWCREGYPRSTKEGTQPLQKIKKYVQKLPLTTHTIYAIHKGIVLRDDILSIQRLMSSFVHLLWSETKVFFVDGPTTFVSFFDGVGAWIVFWEVSFYMLLVGFL